MARKKDKLKTKQLIHAEDAKRQAQLKEQQQKFDKELEKHLDFAQNLVADKVHPIVLASSPVVFFLRCHLSIALRTGRLSEALR